MAGLMGGGRTLVVNLVADTSRFGRQMSNARKDVGGFRGALNGLGRMAGPALAGAAAAAGALAIKFGVDGVQAALDEEQAVSKLAKTLKNLGLEKVTSDVESYIDATQRATGVADDQLRPAFSRLVTSTGDAQKAQELLNVAIDTSVATGKPLETVVAALGKAADGSTAGLSRLGIGIDTAALKSMSLSDITQTLSNKFGGSAASNAETYRGKIARLSVGFDELKESFGMGFLGALEGADGALGDATSTMQDMEPAVETLGTAVGELTALLGDLLGATVNAAEASRDFRNELASPEQKKAFDDLTENIALLINPVGGLILKFMKAREELLALKREAEGPIGSGNYGNGGPNRTPASIENLDNQYANLPKPGRNRSGPLDKGSGPQVIIQTGVGDPVAIAREVERVLRLQETRLGPA